MKKLLAQQPRHYPAQDVAPGNEALRLAAELLQSDGRWPAIDIPGARLGHWNGQKISIARSDLADLINRRLLDSDGRWTEYGRRELARQADIEAPIALVTTR